MDLLVGVTNEDRGDGLALAEQLARAAGADLVLCHIHPEPWRVPGPGKIDAEWTQFLREQSDAELSAALAAASPDLPRPRTHVHGHKSSGRGLAEAADELGAAAIVIGSGPGGQPGRIHGGSTADQLLHGSPVPVFVAPTDYRGSPTPPSRVTVAYQETLATQDATVAAVQLAQRVGVPIRLLTLIRRPHPRWSGGGRALDDLRRDARAWLDQARDRMTADVTCSAEIAEGAALDEAVEAADWQAGDLLVVGSSSAGPVERVFIGDSSVKILRGSPVPACVVPRGVDPGLG